METLLTWVGARDPFWANVRMGGRQEPGPILALLHSRPFDRLLIFVHVPIEHSEDEHPNSFAEGASVLLRRCRQHFPAMQVRQYPVELANPTDYVEIYRAVNAICQRLITKDVHQGDNHLFVYLSPGTPQMQAIWILLVQAGLLPAQMLDATPPDLLKPGQQSWRVVDLSLADFPQVRDPGEAIRELGVLQSQQASYRLSNEHLRTANQRLTAQLDVLRLGSASINESIPDNFDLPGYLDAEKRRLYAIAYEQAAHNVAVASQLLGLPQHTFRQQAERFGLRLRKLRMH